MFCVYPKMRIIYLLCLFLLPSVFTSDLGIVELDEYSFDKIIGKFDAAIVKFDVAFPYGDKHDSFAALAKEAKDLDELLVAQVGVKDYGEMDNDALAAKYGAKKDNFPVVKLFVKGSSGPIIFDDSEGFTSQHLRDFVSKHTALHLSLPGCVRQLDLLVIKFLKSDEEGKKKVLEEVKGAQKELEAKHATSGKVYNTIMQKILEKGDEFVNTEFERLKKILGSKVSDEKKKELETRTNILKTFQLYGQKSRTKEDL